MSARLLTAASKMRAQSSLNQTLFYTGEFVCNVGCNIPSYNLYQRVGRNGSIPYAGPSRCPKGGSVQQGLSAAYEFFDRFKFLCAADKRYTLALQKAHMISYTYIDNSNVFIEAQRVSAVEKGMAVDLYDAFDRKVFDFSYKLDYGKLYEYLCGDGQEVGCAKLWGSPPPSDSFWKMVEKKGFEVKTYDRSFAGKEKKVDVAIAHAITKDAYTKIDKTKNEIVLVAGDKDYMPVIEDLKNEGFRVVVVFWDHAAQEVKQAATKFISLNQWLDYLQK